MFAVYSLTENNEKVPICIFSGDLMSLSAVVKYEKTFWCQRPNAIVKIKAVCLDEKKCKKVYHQNIACKSESEAYLIMSEILEEYETTNELSREL